MPTIAFDMGGVLLTDGSQTAWKKLEVEYGISSEEAAELWYGELQQPADRGEMAEDEIWSALKSLGTDASEMEIRKTFLSEYAPIDQGVGALRTAFSAGWQVLLATNNVSAWVEYWKEKYDWMRLPVAIVCSSDLGVRKPDPSFYAALANTTHSWPAWFVDDKPENLPPAQHVGYVPVHAAPTGRWALPNFQHVAESDRS